MVNLLEQKHCYILLGILLDLAPDKAAQEKIIDQYKEAEKDGIDYLSFYVVSSLVDGVRHGNWPWITTP